MYNFLSLFSVDGFYCAILSDIVLICCCTPDNDVDSLSPDMGRHNFPPPPDAFLAKETTFEVRPTLVLPPPVVALEAITQNPHKNLKEKRSWDWKIVKKKW